MCNVRLEDRISAGEFRTKLKLYSISERLQDRRLRWFGLLERTEKNAGSSNSPGAA